jgi:hypothetical protein
VKLTIDAHERYIILGRTGSGKTEWAKYMLRLISKHMPVVIVDIKEQWLGDYPKWETDRRKPGTVDKPHLVDTFHPKLHVQCIQPDEHGSGDTKLETFCFALLKTRNRFIYFDETEGIATAHMVPAGVRRIWKTGRSKGIGAWVATQTPSGIPRIFKSQADKFVTFQVGEEDIDIAAAIGHAAREEIRGLAPFEYFFYDTKSQDMNGVAQWQPPIPFKKKRST